MNIKEEFGHKYRVKKDECNDCYVPCKYGIIYEYDENTLQAIVYGSNITKAIMREINNNQYLGSKIQFSGDQEIAILFPWSQFKAIAKRLQAKTHLKFQPRRQPLRVMRFTPHAARGFFKKPSPPTL